jgi:hypothetical protein
MGRNAAVIFDALRALSCTTSRASRGLGVRPASAGCGKPGRRGGGIGAIKKKVTLMQSKARMTARARAALVAAVLDLFAVAAAHADAGRYSLEALSHLTCEDALARIDEGVAAKNPHALFASGLMRDEGTCVARDNARAIELFRSALDAGSPDAVPPLALKAGLGDGVTQDYAAAGALLKRIGLRLGAPESVDDYTLGYAYTWLQSTQREMGYPRELRPMGARGTVDLSFVPTQGSYELAPFRRTDNDQPTVGTRIDRSKTIVSNAVREAAAAVSARLPKPDEQRLSNAKFTQRVTLAPSASDVLFGAQPISDPTFVSR